MPIVYSHGHGKYRTDNGWNPEFIYIGNFTGLQPADILENKIEGQDWTRLQREKPPGL